MEEKFKELFWQIFNCNDEDELYKVVTTDQLLNDSNNWYPYGGKSKDDRSNFGTFENQQSNSGAALVEKITNSIDALLLKKCKQQNIDPKSQYAPKTMEEATEKFFNILKGEIGELQSSERTKLAKENIQIIASGEKEKPNLMIWDNGEGQHPKDFKKTFLSIFNNNKTDIPFVQGKYNMGSTGAVVFCGEYRYQLIASKKYTNDGKFGWTLVRRHILTNEENSKYGSSWYEYFAIDGEKIPQFEIDKLNIGLADSQEFITGSFIKLFSYELPKGAKTAIHIGLYRVLNQILYKPAISFLVYEKRKKFESKIREIVVYGNHVRINLDAQENLEIKPLFEKISHEDIGEVSIQIAIFKKGVEERQFIGNKNLIFIQNGQVHGYEGKSFITQDLKFNFLKDSMLVVVNCSKIKTQFRQDLFMANRSNLREGEKLEKLRGKVIELLKGNDTLKRLNADRKNKILQGGDDKKEKALIESLLSKVPLDKSLVNLLKKGVDLVNLDSRKQQTAKKGEETKRPKETKRFPSIFKINIKEDKDTGKKVKSIPLNGKGIIQFETDVIEDYFYRPQEKGEFQIHIFDGQNLNESTGGTQQGNPNKVEDFFEVNQSGPSDGSIKLTLRPKSNLSVGDEIKLNAKLTSPDGDMESLFYVKVVNPQKQENKKANKEPEKPELPKLIKITKDEEGKWKKNNGGEWIEEGWSEDNIIHIITDKQIVSAIAINMDSHSLQKYLSKNQVKKEEEIEFVKKQYLSKVFLHGLFLYSILEKLKLAESQENKYSNTDKNSEELVAEIFKSYSDVLLHLDTNKEILDSIEDN